MKYGSDYHRRIKNLNKELCVFFFTIECNASMLNEKGNFFN